MKVAIVKLSALGDIVHAMVGLQFIKAQVPLIEIDWVVEERYAEILKYNPDINNVLTVDLKSLKRQRSGIFKQIKKIRRYADHEYDLVIDAQGLIKSAITARLLGNHIAGFDAHSIREKSAAWLYDVKISCAYDENTIDRNAMVLSKPLGFTISREQIGNKKPFLFFSENDDGWHECFVKDGVNIIFVIGSTWPSRNYPAEKFVKIAEALQENCLVVWGSEQEKALADWMALQSRHIRVVPRMDLNNLKALIAKADLLIGNDTGPTHMAWGLNRPSITIFGPTPVSRVYQTDINKVVKSPSDVNPLKLNKQDYSIKEIDERDIIDMAMLLLP
ncbi:MAG: lipopolysaccharide heptosyltransferase I [Methylococcaceae bacterium]|nr:lipopolysaccharide heptosyltransferase I [Methylococcaceae bacterium]